MTRFGHRSFPNLREFPYDVRRWCLELEQRINNYVDQVEILLSLTSDGLWVPRQIWSPAITQGAGTSTLTLNHAFYGVANGFCTVSYDVVVATVSSPTAGSEIRMTLPVPARATFGDAARFGTGICIDAGTGGNNRNVMPLHVAGSNTLVRFVDAGVVTAVWGAVPSLTLQVSDRFSGIIVYPVL